jgi:hypothetical protein
MKKAVTLFFLACSCLYAGQNHDSDTDMSLQWKQWLNGQRVDISADQLFSVGKCLMLHIDDVLFKVKEVHSDSAGYFVTKDDLVILLDWN